MCNCEKKINQNCIFCKLQVYICSIFVFYKCMQISACSMSYLEFLKVTYQKTCNTKKQKKTCISQCNQSTFLI